MISFEINHPRFDQEPILTSHCAHQFFIGSSIKSHIKIVTLQSGTFLKVTQDSSGIFIESLSHHYFLHNGVKYQGKRRCQINDSIQIDNSTIKITHFSPENISYPVDYESISIDQRDQEIISALKKELIYSDTSH